MTRFTSSSARATGSKLAVFFLVLGTSFFWSPSANAESTGQITVVCANEAGESREFRVGWDNTTDFFEGKGNIAALFCSIGTQGQWKTFISTTAPESTWYYNGITPTPSPTPTPEPSSSPSPSETPTVTASPSPSPTDGSTATSSPSPSPLETTTAQTPETSSATISPSPQPSETATPIVETVTVISSETSTVPSSSETQSPGPTPVVPPTPPAVEPEPAPTPAPVPAPSPEPQPQSPSQPEPQPVSPPEPLPLPPEPEPVAEPPVIEPEPAPEPVPEPPAVEPEPPVVAEEPPVVIPDPEPIPEPAPEPAPEPPVVEDNPTPEPEVVQVSEEPPVAEPNATEEEKQVVAQAIIEQAQGEPVTAQAIADAGLTYADLPPETPVEVREDENGNEVVITAEVAAALVVLADPGALIEAIFTDPGQALLAIASIGADMSDEERTESEKIIVASVIAGQVAVGAAGAAAAYRRKP